jgi:uncharacterized protein (DUF488 family)
MSAIVYTIGHSNRQLEDFLSILLERKVTAVADVRSRPYSRANPQFNRESLAKSLARHEIAYVFLGQELGARTSDPTCYVGGKVQYEMLAQTKLFQSGLDRIEKGVLKHEVALMCAEKEPLLCHRSILVARYLIQRGLQIRHIIDGTVIEDHDSSIERLLSILRIDNAHMFKRDDLVALAYEWQGSKIAFALGESHEAKHRESA